MNTATTILNSDDGIVDKFNSLQYEAAFVVDTGIADIVVNITQAKDRAIYIES